MSHKHHSSHEHRRGENWRIDVVLEQRDGETVATTDLYAGDATYEAHGCTHATEVDPSVAREMAVARALSGLAHQLVNDASHTVSRAAHALSTATDDLEETNSVLEQGALCNLDRGRLHLARQAAR
jgi:hypothetical protein